VEFLGLCKTIKKSITKFTTPFLCLQGTDDVHVQYSTSKKFYKECNSNDKTFIKLNGFKNGKFFIL
jgi:esterase/lipase